MDTEIEVIMAQNKRMAERMDGITKLIDTDRQDIDQLKIDVSSIKVGQEVLLKQMIDFKQEMRALVEDVIKESVPKAVKKAIAKELTTMSLENPKKIIVRRTGFWEAIIRIFKR